MSTKSEMSSSDLPSTRTVPSMSWASVKFGLAGMRASWSVVEQRPGFDGRRRVALEFVDREASPRRSIRLLRARAGSEHIGEVEHRITAMRQQVGRLQKGDGLARQDLGLLPIPLAGEDLRLHPAPDRLR